MAYDLPAILKYFVIFSASYMTTLLLTPAVSRFAWRYGIVDKPDEARRIHKHDVPRCGGLAVYAGTLVGGCALYFLPWSPMNQMINWQAWLQMNVAALLLVTIGFIDDYKNLRAIYKLLGQCVVALLMYSFHFRVGTIAGFPLPVFIDLLATVFWFVFIINAFNLIDGFDGLAAGLTIISAMGIAGTLIFRQLPFEALLLTALIGSCAAFLKFNAHPARIFLGDTGSMFLGFSLAAIALGTASKGSSIASIWVPVLALGVPIFDTILAIWRRAARKVYHLLQRTGLAKGIMAADMEHLHHRLMKAGFTPRNVTLVLYLANTFLVLAGLTAIAFRDSAIAIFLTSFVIAAFFLFRAIARRELWDSGLLLLLGLGNWTRPTLNIFLYTILDSVGLSLCLMLSIIAAFPANSFANSVSNLAMLLPVWVGVPLLLLIVFEFLRRKKALIRRPSLQQVLSFCMVAGLILLTVEIFLNAFSIENFSSIILPEEIINEDPSTKFFSSIFLGTFYCALSFPYLVGIRKLPAFIEFLMIRSISSKEKS